MNDISVLNLFLEAGMVVKTVMVILLIASLLTWIVIVERYNFYRKIRLINDSFLDWSPRGMDEAKSASVCFCNDANFNISYSTFGFSCCFGRN